jgi:hypothetical protein
MGLTWIDHDTIDNPIEDLGTAAEVAKLDIEFTVETFKTPTPSSDGATSSLSGLSAGSAGGIIRRESVMGKKVKKICSKVR